MNEVVSAVNARRLQLIGEIAELQKQIDALGPQIAAAKEGEKGPLEDKKKELERQRDEKMQRLSELNPVEQGAKTHGKKSQEGDPIPPPPPAKNDEKKKEEKKDTPTDTKTADAGTGKGFTAPAPAQESNRVNLTSNNSQNPEAPNPDRTAQMSREIANTEEITIAQRALDQVRGYQAQAEAARATVANAAPPAAPKPTVGDLARQTPPASLTREIASAESIASRPPSVHLMTVPRLAVGGPPPTAITKPTPVRAMASYGMDPSSATAVVTSGETAQDRVVARERAREVGRFMTGHSATVVGSTREQRHYTPEHQAAIAHLGSFVSPASLR